MDFTKEKFTDEDLQQQEENQDMLHMKENNYFTFHENMQHYDPKGQPFSYFYVTIMGQIQFGEFLDLDGLSVKYDFVAGEDWQVSSGKVKGVG
jgi:hypothetical protein